MKAWHIGNTTVRSPFRLRDAVKALSDSSLLGNLYGRDNEHAFSVLLLNNGVLQSPRLAEGKQADDLGRKWRSALTQLGFLVPRFTKILDVAVLIPGFSLREGIITPSGRLLIEAESVPAIQEVFLRSLVAYQIPSVLETSYECKPFKPLIHVLTVMVELYEQAGSSSLSFPEIAYILQRSYPGDGVEHIVQEVLSFRETRLVDSNKKSFDKRYRERVVQLDKPEVAGNQTSIEQAANTLRDYADLNLRYLKATGLFASVGKGIVLLSEKDVIIRELVENSGVASTPEDYVSVLWRGAELPTDHPATSRLLITSLCSELQKRGVEETFVDTTTFEIQELTSLVHQLEDKLQLLKEQQFADEQQEKWIEIEAYLEAIATNSKKVVLSTGETISIPNGETPAYLEWILWRVFLAVDSLVNKPWEARRFKVDQDFLPVGVAASRGPDLIFEFERFVLVVEATLTSSSRQEAAEGEPVRRHVADIVEVYESKNKPVYGLFIANIVDSNTAETLRIGAWYRRDDSKMSLQIVPLTIGQLLGVVRSRTGSNKNTPAQIERLLRDCLAMSNLDAPAWKQAIQREVSRFISENSA